MDEITILASEILARLEKQAVQYGTIGSYSAFEIKAFKAARTVDETDDGIWLLLGDIEADFAISKGKPLHKDRVPQYKWINLASGKILQYKTTKKT